MAKIGMRERDLWDANVYDAVCTEIAEGKRQVFGAKSRREWEPCLVFHFKDADGRELIKTTGTTYGGKRAALTGVVDGLAGRPLAKEEVPEFDTDMLVATKCRIMVTKATDEDGEPYNEIVSIERSGKPLASFAPTIA